MFELLTESLRRLILGERGRIAPARRMRSQFRDFSTKRRPYVEALEDRWLLAIFTVTNTNDSGPGSLRQAILSANANPDADTINFSIGVGLQTIRPSSPLPSITDRLTIDGTTQPGFAGRPLIELNGSSAGSGRGLHITAGSSVVRGLVINRFSGTGIRLETNGNNVIAGNYIGTDVTGMSALGNSGAGVIIYRCPNNTIGGATPELRNVISGNSGGLVIDGPEATGNRLLGNYIGTNSAGSGAVGNTAGGVLIFFAPGNFIGGTTPAVRNVISGNGGPGIRIEGELSRGNFVQGNFVGTDAAGRTPLGNMHSGVWIIDGSNTTVGGPTAEARNLISGNLGKGIFVVGYDTRTGNLIQGNYIGTDIFGFAPVSNREDGVFVEGPPVTIGGTTAGARNVIAGNYRTGVTLRFTTGSVVQGNYIGLGADGRYEIGNGSHGVLVAGPTPRANLIGGTAAGAGNLIAYSYNGGSGVFIDAAVGNPVRRNSIFFNTGPGIGGASLPPAPALTRATSTADATTIEGTLTGTPNGSYEIEFFTDMPFGPRRDTFLGATTVTTDGGGTANLIVTFGGHVPPGLRVLATATGPNNTTSRFSAPQTVTPSQPATHFRVTAPPRVVPAAPFTVTVSARDAAGNVDPGYRGTVRFSSSDGAATLPADYTFTPADFGVRTFSVTLRTAGNRVLQVATIPAGALTGSATVTVIPAGARRYTVTTAADSGAGSLRQAFLDANAAPGLDLIDFRIGTGVQTIRPTSALPSLTDPVVLDATTQPGFVDKPVIEISGVSAGASANGLTILAGHSVVRGLVINRFGASGIRLDAGGNNLIEGNFLGTNVAGTAALGNAIAGLELLASPGNVIGGLVPAARNLISGNGREGVSIYWGPNSTNNVVQGNYIGTDLTGTLPLENRDWGLLVASPNNLIGGTAPGAGNLISGNGIGITLSNAGANGNRVQGNFIGTNASGTAALRNRFYGVALANGANTTLIGGPPAARNVISGNGFGGVVIYGVGGTRGNQVQGNFIGTTPAGTAPLGNGVAGVALYGSQAEVSGNVIGGTTADARNLISGNETGVYITGSGARSNVVQGNFIGTDVSGARALGNTSDGVRIRDSASNNLIGGAAEGASNILAHNGANGVSVESASGNAIRRNAIFANAGLGIAGIGLGIPPILQLSSSTAAGTGVQGVTSGSPNSLVILEFFANTACDPSGSGEGESYLGSATVTTDGSGNAEFVTTFATAVPTGRFLTATATRADNTTSSFATCSAVRSGREAARFRVNGPSGVSAGVPLTVTVTALDVEGYVAPFYRGTVQFTSTDPQATLPPDYTFTAADAGSRTFTTTLRTAGLQSLRGTDRDNPAVAGEATPEVRPAAAAFLYVDGPASARAGTPYAFTVYAFDAYWNLATDYAGTVRFTGSDPQATLPGEYRFTPGDYGSRVFTATLRTADWQSLTVTDTIQETLTSGLWVMVNPGPVAAFYLDAPAGRRAGMTFDLGVYAADTFGNLVTDYTGRVRFDSTDPLATLPAEYTFTPADGGFRVFSGLRLRTADWQSVTVTDVGDGAVRGRADLYVTPGPARAFYLDAPPSVPAGTPFAATVVVVDEFGNVAWDYAGRVRFSSTDPDASLPAEYTFTVDDLGVRTFTGLRLRTVGDQTLSVWDVVDRSVEGLAYITVEPTGAPGGDTGANSPEFFGLSSDAVRWLLLEEDRVWEW